MFGALSLRLAATRPLRRGPRPLPQSQVARLPPRLRRHFRRLHAAPFRAGGGGVCAHGTRIWGGLYFRGPHAGGRASACRDTTVCCGGRGGPGAALHGSADLCPACCPQRGHCPALVTRVTVIDARHIHAVLCTGDNPPAHGAVEGAGPRRHLLGWGERRRQTRVRRRAGLAPAALPPTRVKPQRARRRRRRACAPRRGARRACGRRWWISRH